MISGKQVVKENELLSKLVSSGAFREILRRADTVWDANKN